MWPAPGGAETAHSRTHCGASPRHGTPGRAWRVPSSAEPGSGTASLALVGERLPGLELIRPAPEDVLEAAKGPAARDDDRQPIGPVPVGERLDEVLHIAVGGLGALAPHGEPVVRVLVVGNHFSLFAGVVDRRLRPDLPGAKVDPAAAMGRVTLEDARQLLEVDGKRTQHGCGPVAERGVELVGEIVVARPGAPAKLLGAAPGQVGRSHRALGQREEESVTCELEQIAPETLRECDDDASTVPIADGAPKSRSAIVGTPHQFQPGTVAIYLRVPTRPLW